MKSTAFAAASLASVAFAQSVRPLVQQRFEVLEGGGEEAALELDTLKQIQAVLYSTEEGFEVPEGGEVSWCSRRRDASPGSHIIPRPHFSATRRRRSDAALPAHSSAANALSC